MKMMHRRRVLVASKRAEKARENTLKQIAALKKKLADPSYYKTNPHRPSVLREDKEENE